MKMIPKFRTNPKMESTPKMRINPKIEVPLKMKMNPKCKMTQKYEGDHKNEEDIINTGDLPMVYKFKFIHYGHTHAPPPKWQ